MGFGKENHRQEKGKTENGTNPGLAGVRACVEKPVTDMG